jgi:hypothetical protein
MNESQNQPGAPSVGSRSEARGHAIRCAAAAVCAALTAAAAPGARAQPATADACVSTPAEYAKAFENCQPIPCTSANLYGVIGQGTPEQQTSVYPEAFYWAWVAGYESLQYYADWQVQAYEGQLPRSEVTRRISCSSVSARATSRPGRRTRSP